MHLFSSLISGCVCCLHFVMSARLLREDSSLSEATPPPPIIPCRLYWSPRMMCLTTKPVIVILLWVFVVACVFSGIHYAGIVAALNRGNYYQPLSKLSFIYMILIHAFIAVTAVSYPIGGFINPRRGLQ